jgi:hypothetical protein
VTTGSYNRNLTTPTMGRYSGPYTVGSIQTKTWSGQNYPSGEPQRTNVYPPSFKGPAFKTSIRWQSVWTPEKRVRYVKVYNDDISVIRHTSVRPPDRPVRGYSWEPRQFTVMKKKRVPLNVVTGYLVRPRIRYNRVPKRGRLVDHPYSCSFMNSVSAIENFTYPGVGNFSQPTYNLLSSYSIVGGWSSNDDLTLLGRLRTAVAGSEFNAGIALAESTKTLQMIANNANRIYMAMRHVRHGNFNSAVKHLVGHVQDRDQAHKFDRRYGTGFRTTTVQSRWLELQYGWLPLLNDVYAGAQFLAHQLEVPIQQTVRVRMTNRSAKVNWIPSAGWKYATSEIITRKQIKATIFEANPYQLAGLANPASVAWELVPWSFVADWFIPIGSYLDARGLEPALSARYVTSASYRERHSGFAPYNQPLTGRSRTGPSTLEQGSMSRTVGTTLQIPLPSWKPLSQVASWKHCANAVALLTSRKSKTVVTDE